MTFKLVTRIPWRFDRRTQRNSLNFTAVKEDRLSRVTTPMAAGVASKCASQAWAGYQIRRVEILPRKGVEGLKIGHYVSRQLGIRSGNLAIRLDYVFNSHRIVCQVFGDSTSIESDGGVDFMPTPIVLIDQDSDPNATIVEISFGDRLGALIDTTKALTDLGLDVAKGRVFTEASVIRTKFFITRSDTGRKVENPELLEQIRLTIINNLLKYHPESSENLAMGEAFGIKPPKKKLDIDVATHIHIADDGPRRRSFQAPSVMPVIPYLNSLSHVLHRGFGRSYQHSKFELMRA